MPGKFFYLLPLVLLPVFAFAESPKSPAPSAAGEEVDVEKIKEKYWARGNETEMGVVQNRLYPKFHRFEIGFLGGNLSGDPFLTTLNAGFSTGFHFSEFLGVHVQYWQAFVSPSSALTTLQNDLNTTTNTNEVRRYLGGDLRASVLYGKLSLLGAAILYFDAYFSLGAGRITTESGNSLLLSVGIGQQIHLSRVFSVNLDYKVVRYREDIIGKISGTDGNLGEYIATRNNLSALFTIGFSVFLDPLPGDNG
jgi:outer membrane beta-barrel protein